MSRIVEAAATMGTGSDALKRKLRARVLDVIDDVVGAEEQAADAAEGLRQGRDDDRDTPLEAHVLERAAAAVPSVPVPCASSTTSGAS